MTDFERIVEFRPAFDRRHRDPSKDYGIHGVDLKMILKGPLGATQFLLFTQWQLPHVTEETLNHLAMCQCSKTDLKVSFLPIPADLGYHWRQSRYEGQTRYENCELCDGAPCYYSSSVLNADRIYQQLLTGGSEAVWLALADYYEELKAE